MGFATTVAPSVVSLAKGHSSSAYLRSDQSGEREGNKQVGAVIQRTVLLSARTSRVV